MEAINFQHLAFKQLTKDLANVSTDAVRQRTLAIISYFGLIGGGASEYNILHLMRYAGISFNDEEHQDIVRRILSFYCGGGLIRVIDNGLGIREMILDKNSEAYRKGKNEDMSAMKKVLDSQRALLKGLVEERKMD